MGGMEDAAPLVPEQTPPTFPKSFGTGAATGCGVSQIFGRPARSQTGPAPSHAWGRTGE
jgi:hypothetical protein